MTWSYSSNKSDWLLYSFSKGKCYVLTILDLTKAESQLANLQTPDVLNIIINPLSGMEFLSLGYMSSMIQPFQKLYSNFLKSLRESCYCKVCVPPTKTQDCATQVCWHKAQVSPAGSLLCKLRGSVKELCCSQDFLSSSFTYYGSTENCPVVHLRMSGRQFESTTRQAGLTPRQQGFLNVIWNRDTQNDAWSERL
jgi:hypothetical protein